MLIFNIAIENNRQISRKFKMNQAFERLSTCRGWQEQARTPAVTRDDIAITRSNELGLYIRKCRGRRNWSRTSARRSLSPSVSSGRTRYRRPSRDCRDRSSRSARRSTDCRPPSSPAWSLPGWTSKSTDCCSAMPTPWPPSRGNGSCGSTMCRNC